MNIVDIKERLHDECVLNVISYSQYMPTEEKLNKFADKCGSDSSISAFACEDNGFICGVIVLKHTGDTAFEIMSIATNPDYRKHGVASSLVSFAAGILKCSEIKAETDDDAVDFYHKYGFHIESLGEKYPGIIRYLCTLKLM